ncbi:MAG: gamma-glutamylcyclotransferase [Gammaproteobacteria bacterium]
MSRHFLYFAYGSNMHPLRLAERTPSCEPLGVARLDRHLLRFHKRSRVAGDLSGKCNVFATGRPGDVVHGVVYRIREVERAALDEAEGAGRGYESVTMRVSMGSSRIEAWSYRAHPEWVDDGLRPYDWYLALVAGGADYHGLPTLWRESLRKTATVADPDRGRAARWLALAACVPEASPDESG